jgi:formylglycine-generating enzyme required for sulfatase activity
VSPTVGSSRSGRGLPAAVVAVLIGLAAGYALLRPGAGAGPAHPDEPPHPSALDSLNPAVFLEGGTFWKGSREPDTVDVGPYVTYDESYGRATVEPFWIQRHEVTNQEYRRFDAKHAFPPGAERHPVVGVTWDEARNYAGSLGGRLPTETEWEFAARGTASRTYPWGDGPPACDRAQFAGCQPAGTVDVMSPPRGATPEGLHGLAGNVWEWVVPDWFDPPRFPANDESRRLRGGGFRDEPFFLRAANRNNEFARSFTGDDIGFRVVWSGR